jgi:ribosomal protein S18 acetylase RimI-like enzyme
MLEDMESTFNPFPKTVQSVWDEIVWSGPDIHLVAEDLGRVAAYGILRWNGPGGNDDPPALGLAVAKSCRRMGLGTAMLAVLHYMARERGCSTVILHVDAKNEAAIVMYEKAGYSWVSQENGVIRMERAL